MLIWVRLREWLSIRFECGLVRLNSWKQDFAAFSDCQVASILRDHSTRQLQVHRLVG